MLVLTINGLLGRTKRGGYNPPPVKLDPVIPPPDPDPDPDPDPPEELPPEVLPNPATGTPLFTATFENADTVPTWEGQPFHFGQEWVKGEVPDGNYVRPEINGVLIPAQLSERVTWNDGSLKFAQVSVNVPSIPAGGSLTVTWKRFTGSWTTMDEVTHTSPKSVTDHVNLEYVFSSWKGKDASNILTEEKGPKTFLSSRLLGPSNSEWVETYGAGRVCTEWKATDYALLIWSLDPVVDPAPLLDRDALRAGFAKRDPELGPLDVMVSAPLAIGDDVDDRLAWTKPQLALYIGGMGARGKNFYHSLATRYGYGEVADRIQDLYLAGKKAEAIDAEFASLHRVSAESLSGARRFADGAGRHGAKA